MAAPRRPTHLGRAQHDQPVVPAALHLACAHAIMPPAFNRVHQGAVKSIGGTKAPNTFRKGAT